MPILTSILNVSLLQLIRNVKSEMQHHGCSISRPQFYDNHMQYIHVLTELPNNAPNGAALSPMTTDSESSWRIFTYFAACSILLT